MLGNRFAAHFLEDTLVIPSMRRISNIVYQMQHLTISFILDLQENIYKQVPMSAGFAGRHVVDVGNLSINIFLEVQDKTINKYCI